VRSAGSRKTRAVPAMSAALALPISQNLRLAVDRFGTSHAL
jgi:hypothetical protein